MSRIRTEKVKRMIATRVRMIIVIAVGLALWDRSVSAQIAKPREPSSPRKETSPQFEDYPVVEEFHGKPARVDLSSHPDARTFRTRLIEGAKKGPNFGGHYALIWWGCGNECQMSLLIDLHTGIVYGLAEPPSKRPLESSRGLEFGPTSKLLIVDPPCPEDYNPCVSFGRSGEPVRYYLMEDNGLRLIHKTPCELVSERQQCGDQDR